LRWLKGMKFYIKGCAGCHGAACRRCKLAR